MVRSPHRRACSVLLAGGLATALLAGCGSGSSGTPSGGGSSSVPTTKKVDSIASQVPSAIRSKGTLIVAADATYAPDEFVQPGSSTVIGMDPDLAKALGQVMGLQVQVQNVTFDNIIPGMQSGKYDLGMSSFTDTKAREKVVDFVTYFSSGEGFYVKAQGGPTINTLADLCGHKVAVEKGTVEQDDANAQSKKCTAAGKPAVTVEIFNDQSGANLAVSSGRADVGFLDSQIDEYLVKQSNGQFKLTGSVFGTAPYGIAIPKNNGMAKPVLAALQELMKNGTYKKILDKWGIASGAINNPTINGATS